MEVKPKILGRIVFIALPLIPLVLFWIMPLLVSVWISFTNWDFISPSFDYVGFANYTELITDESFKQAAQRTLYFTFFSVLPILIFGFLIAVALQKLKRSNKFLRGLIFSPWVTPMIGMSIVWSWLFNAQTGPINQILGILHLPQPAWLTDSNTAIWTVIIVTVWKNIGWASLFYTDALSKIPSSVIEVAEVEGVSSFQRMRHILLPLVSPTTIFLTIVSILDCLQAYDQITVLTQGGPAGSTRTLLYLYYELGFAQFDTGKATALAIVLLIITAILSFILIRVTKKRVFY